MDLKPIDPANFLKLHQFLGMALWHGQELESLLAQFITLILKLPPSHAEAETLEILEKMQHKTLGALMTEIKKANSTNSVSAFELRMDKFLKERNWLVHSSWREHHADLFSPEKLPPLFSRLQLLADEATALRKYFAELVHAWVLHQPGVTPEKLEAGTKKILQDRGVIQ